MSVNGSGQNVQSLERTFHRCFLPSFSSFGWGVSEEKIKMWKVNGGQTPDAKWWQTLTLPLARRANKVVVFKVKLCARASVRNVRSNYIIGICWFSAQHGALNSKRKDGCDSRVSIMYKSGALCLPVDCCFSETTKIQLKMLVNNQAAITTSPKSNLFSQRYTMLGLRCLTTFNNISVISWC